MRTHYPAGFAQLASAAIAETQLSPPSQRGEAPFDPLRRDAR